MYNIRQFIRDLANDPSRIHLLVHCLHRRPRPQIIRLVNFIARSFAFSSTALASALTTSSWRRSYKQPKLVFLEEGNDKHEEEEAV